MILVFTGNGKGKTTSALGQALRAVGEGKRVLMVQFIKGPWKSGEDEAHKKLSPDFQIIKKGIGFVGILGDTHTLEEHQKAAADGFLYARDEIKSGAWDIIILDEINNAVHLNLITKEEVQALLFEVRSKNLNKPEHIILTGRDAPREFIDLADLVSEIRDCKHPYDSGIKGKRGLEY